MAVLGDQLADGRKVSDKIVYTGGLLPPRLPADPGGLPVPPDPLAGGLQPSAPSPSAPTHHHAGQRGASYAVSDAANGGANGGPTPGGGALADLATLLQ